MQPAFSLHCMYTPGTLQVHSSSGRAMAKAGGLTSTSSCIFFKFPLTVLPLLDVNSNHSTIAIRATYQVII